MQKKDVAKITLEDIHRDALIYMLLFLHLKDLSNFSKTSKFCNALFKELLKKFDHRLALEWIEKIKADITSKPPLYASNKVFQYKKFYVTNMVEKSELNKSIFATARRNLNTLFRKAHLSSFSKKMGSYSAFGLDVQLSRLFENNPEMTKEVYSNPGYRSYIPMCIRDAIASGYNRIFDLHFAALKGSINSDISTVINNIKILHFAVQKANLYCVKVLLEHGGNPLVKTFSSKSTSYAIASMLDSKSRDAIFDLFVKSTGEDKIKADLNDLNPDAFEEKYGISKSSISSTLEQTQDHQQPSKVAPR